MLRADVARRLDAFELDAALAVDAGAVVVLVGESGSGKTTLLRMLAGLLRPDRGRIELDGEVWFDSANGRWTPPERRAVGYVAQDYALFPHLSAFDNVAFGLRARGVAPRDLASRVGAALERLGVGALARRRPHELSGGQQQRVAIARAIVTEPRLLLLDEPLSALDAQSRRAIRPELRRLLDELACATVYVTHHPTEALAFGRAIAVVEAGRISQSGSRDDLMRHPCSRYVAEFLGVNFIRGTMAAEPPPGAPHLVLPDGVLLLHTIGGESDATAIVHPRDITLTRERPDGSARNVFEGTIDELAPEPPNGERVRVSIASRPPLIAEVTRGAVESLVLQPGTRVFASFKASGVIVPR